MYGNEANGANRIQWGLGTVLAASPSPMGWFRARDGAVFTPMRAGWSCGGWCLSPCYTYNLLYAISGASATRPHDAAAKSQDHTTTSLLGLLGVEM